MVFALATEDLLIRISERGANQTANQLGKVGKAGAAVGAAVAAGAAVAGYGIKKAMDFETIMSEVKAVTGATSADMKTMSAAALELGASSGLGASAAAQAMAELGKAGLDAKTVIGTLPATITLARAGSMELAAAASATADTMGLFGLKASQAGHIADVFATAANQTTADVSDFTLAIKQGGSAAAAAGLSFDETTAGLMALAKGGIRGSDAGTSLKAMLTQLAKPTKESAALMKELGIDVWDAQGNMKSLPAVAAEVRGSMKNLTREQRLNAATTISGTDGQRALLALYREGKGGITGYLGALKEQGTAAEVAAEKQNNLRGALARVKATFDSFLIEKITPYLKEVGAEINSFLDALQDGEGKWGEFIRGVKGAGRWLGEFAETLAESVSPIVSDVGRVIGRLIEQFQEGRGIGGLFRGALAALGDIAMKAAGSFDDVWNALKSTGEFVVKNQDAFIVFGAILAGFMAPLALYRTVLLAWSAATAVSAFTAGAAATATAAWGVAIALVTSPIGLVVAAVAGLIAGLVLLWKKNEGFRTWVKGAWSDISSWIKGAADDIGNWFSGIPGTLKGVFDSIINFFIGGINNVIKVMNTAIELYNRIPMAPDIQTIGLIEEVGGGDRRNTRQSVGTDSSHAMPGLAQGGVVRGVGSFAVGEYEPEVATKRADGSLVIEPLSGTRQASSGGMGVTIVARDGAMAAILEQLIERVEFSAARAG